MILWSFRKFVMPFKLSRVKIFSSVLVKTTSSRRPLSVRALSAPRSPHAYERGQSGVEMAMLLSVLLLIVGGIMTIGPVVYINIAVMNAANDCAFAAAQTLDITQSRFQGINAAQETLSGFHINASNAAIGVYGGGLRGAPVTCSVSYMIDFTGIPMHRLFQADPNAHFEVTLPAQNFKSVWR